MTQNKSILTLSLAIAALTYWPFGIFRAVTQAVTRYSLANLWLALIVGFIALGVLTIVWSALEYRAMSQRRASRMLTERVCAPWSHPLR